MSSIENPNNHVLEFVKEDDLNEDRENIGIDKPLKDAPEDLFEAKTERIDEKEYVKGTPLERLDKMINLYYTSNPFENKIAELEIRFGTKGIKPLTKNDYDNVIKKLKSSGFQSDNENGESSLRIQTEYLDRYGTFRESNVRIEINGLYQIQKYCKSDDIQQIKRYGTKSLNFVKKSVFQTDSKTKIFPINFDDFNYRASLQTEDKITPGLQTYMMSNWKECKKTFRYMNRVTFVHPDHPVKVDISIVKYGIKDVGRYNKMKWVWNVNESKVFTNNDTYEIEIEVDNDKIGPGTKYNSPESLMNFDCIRKVIKLIVCGLQTTNFPCSYPEQNDVLSSYMKLLNHVSDDQYNRVKNKHFIGPNSITLQMENIATEDVDSKIINIRKNYTVTDKADGDRNLMYINQDGKIYLINTNMKVIFTGAVTDNKDCFNSLIDGELISYDKFKNFINLYAAFDIYYLKKEDVRSLSFMRIDNERDLTKSRYNKLQNILASLNAYQIGTKSKKDGVSVNSSPMRFVSKEFYPLSRNDSIFSACNSILSKIKEGLFEYNTDGLIFTPAHFGVGSNKIGTSGPKTKITWENSFKWKPPEYNTIDFLVTTLKKDGDDDVKTIFEDGVNVDMSAQLTEYKTIQLRCTYNQKMHGYVNPCQYLIDDKFPESNNKYEDADDNESKPVIFYPTEPYDSEAGTCKIILRKDDNNNNQMFTHENEVFNDNTIVEFSYDLTREHGWNWVPLRVRYDKTTELLQGNKNFGNAYHVANSNWKSIHNPISVEMISTGLNIPDVLVNEDKYYNNSTKQFKTKCMKDFHNLFIKKMLIKCVSKKGDTLIDFACGKAGDLPKWVRSQLSFVFGIDIHNDNLENNKDGACARYIEMRRKEERMPSALFVNGNSAFNIKSGEAMLNDKAKQITKAIFGTIPRDESKLGKGVVQQYAKGVKGFNISSCQFAVHYFFENPTVLMGFLRNVSECTQEGGYFIGTAYDGKMIFDLLKQKKQGESVEIVQDGKKVWKVTKGYDNSTFETNSSSIGYKIDVYQDSIDKTFSEYLINFDYMNRIIEQYGFKLLDREEAQTLGLPEGSGSFQELFNKMLGEIKQNKYANKDLGCAANLTEYEKTISFLNRYFVYKKVVNVNAEKIQIDLSDYKESLVKNDVKETEEIEEIEEKPKPKLVRKLSRKILLVPGTEAIDAEEEKQNQEQSKPTKQKKVKKLKIVE